MIGNSAIRVFDVVRALAFVGDLSMGQPTDHSIRTAWIADRIALSRGCGITQRNVVRQAALLRWSGCTANAGEFADLLGDDVSGRKAMLALRPGWSSPTDALGGIGIAIPPLALIHCEVSGEVARILGLDAATELALRNIFEAYDGCGLPGRLRGCRVPPAVSIVTLAGDIEVFTRVYGAERALALVMQRGDRQYSNDLIEPIAGQIGVWLGELEKTGHRELEACLLTEQMELTTSAELIADVIDLKLPWMTGFSRRVARTAAACAVALGLGPRSELTVYRAGLLHGVGRAAIPNSIWGFPGPLTASAWERVRLAPYWTSRVAKQIGVLQDEAEIASYAYERHDGSGYFRSVAGHNTPIEGRILAAAVAWVALRSDRPWRRAMSGLDALNHMTEEARAGCFDPGIVGLVGRASNSRAPVRAREAITPLSVREAEVLRHISVGASNKEVARALDVSPSTVRTHVENVFRKLNCSTRAAATLKASSMGIL